MGAIALAGLVASLLGGCEAMNTASPGEVSPDHVMIEAPVNAAAEGVDLTQPVQKPDAPALLMPVRRDSEEPERRPEPEPEPEREPEPELEPEPEPPVECVPDCDGAECGDDGCGGACGECAGNDVCSAGICVDPQACCDPSESAGCVDPVVEACVCEGDGFCCETMWDSVCAESAEADCGVECPAPREERPSLMGKSCCEEHATGFCDDYIWADVCDEDPMCCMMAWDAECVAAAIDAGFPCP